MHPSQKIIDFIESYEKCRLQVYMDQAGRPTIGWGHLIGYGEDYSYGITQDHADDLFDQDLQERAVNPVSKAIDVSLSQQEFDACVALCFNIGSHNFATSSVVRLINAGQPASIIVQHFLLWDKVTTSDGLVVSDGLLSRRRAEGEIFMNGNYVNHN